MISPHVHIPYHKIGDFLPFIKENRINLEIYFLSDSLDTITGTDIIKLKESLDYHPSLTIHAPFMDLSPGAVDSKVRAVTIERFLHIFRIAEILSTGSFGKPEVIVFHSGYEKWKYALNIDLWLEKSIKTWTPLAKNADEIGVRIAIENIFEDEPTNLKLLMQELGSERFGICFDTGHFNLFSKTPLNEWLEVLKPYIIELHLHDNDRTADTHNPIGDGTFDFDTLFSILKGKDLIYTIEAHSAEDAMKGVERLKKYII
jgi:sugar phosphate isomerase/epimerase